MAFKGQGEPKRPSDRPQEALNKGGGAGAANTGQRGRADAAQNIVVNGPPSITVAVVAHRSGGIIGDCLRSVRQQDYPQQLVHIVVVDDSDDEDTKRACAEHLAKYVYAPHTDTPGKARNVALENTSTDIVAFLDTDCLAPRNWLRSIVCDLQEHPEVAGVVGCYTGGKNWIQRVFNQEEVRGYKEVKTPAGILEGNCAFWAHRIRGKWFGVHRYSEGNVLSAQLVADGQSVLLDYDLKVVHRGFTYTPRKFYEMGVSQFHNNRDYFGGSLRGEAFSVAVVLSLILLGVSPLHLWLLASPSLMVTAVFVWFSKKYQKTVAPKWIVPSYLYFVFMRWIYWIGYFTELVRHVFR